MTIHGSSAPRNRPLVTLDGPAGSGKSTTAREVAERLGFLHLDSGAIYRVLTLALLRSHRPVDSWPDLTPDDLASIPIGVEVEGAELKLFLGEQRVTTELRTPEVTHHVSVAAGIPAVRARLLGLQREAGATGGLVADGRDMGTVVFPDAELKVFLVADLEERARRRLIQDGTPGPSPEEVRQEAQRIQARDAADAGRSVAPLVQPEDALVLDTTALTFEEQVSRIESAARALMDPEFDEE